MKRVAVVSSLAMVFGLAFASPALAIPGNDTYVGRASIVSLPFSDAVDTSTATTDPDDDEGLLLVDVSASDYSAGVIVATGAPGSFEIQNCGPGGTAFFAVAGETYTILAFDDQLDGTGIGGALVISVEPLPPPPEIDVTVDGVGRFNPATGGATISGTVTCSAEAAYAFVYVELRQRAGRLLLTGTGGVDVYCDGSVQAWSAEVFAWNGLFTGGRATAMVFGTACGIFDCGFAEQQRTVRLRR
jgi:hypothetical protein